VRARVHLRVSLLVYLTRALTLGLAAILIWYGAMLMLLAVKVSPHTVNSLSGYRTIYDFLARLRSSDFSTLRRLVAGFGGFAAFLALVYLALQELPRPYLVSQRIPLETAPGGSLTVEPRVLERLAEYAAVANDDVGGAAGRLGSESLSLGITVRRPGSVAETLVDVRERVLAALGVHQLPGLVVDVTVTKLESPTGRNLS
jgi:hypothetical protein